MIEPQVQVQSSRRTELLYFSSRLVIWITVSFFQRSNSDVRQAWCDHAYVVRDTSDQNASLSFEIGFNRILEPVLLRKMVVEEDV